MVLPLASLFFFANFWGLPEKVDLETSHRVDPADSFGDEDIRVLVNVSNKTSAPLGNVEIEEYLPSIIKLERGTSRALTRLDAGEKAELSLEFKSPIRGHYNIGPFVARVRDPFGFYLVEKRSEAQVLSIMPRPERIRGAELRPRHLGPWPGMIHARIRGPGTEFYSMRDYVSGDDRNILFLLAAAKPGRAMLSTSYVMTLLAHLMLPAMAQIVIISPLLDSALVGGIRGLAATGYSILVVSPSPRQPVKFESENEEIAYRVLMLERSNTLLALEKVCTVAQWPAGVPLSTVLREVKRSRLMIRV